MGHYRQENEKSEKQYEALEGHEGDESVADTWGPSREDALPSQTIAPEMIW